MNLSRVKIVGFIPNFERSGSYPNVVAPIEAVITTPISEIATIVSQTIPVVSQLAKVKSISKHIAHRLKVRELTEAKSDTKCRFIGFKTNNLADLATIM